MPTSWSTTRARIRDRDGRRCRLCGRFAIRVDHLVTPADGGTDDDANLGLICDDCDRERTSAQGHAGRAVHR